MLPTDWPQLWKMIYLFVCSFTRYLLVPFMWGWNGKQDKQKFLPLGSFRSNLIQGCQVPLYRLCTAQEHLVKQSSWVEFPTLLAKLLSPKGD